MAGKEESARQFIRYLYGDSAASATAEGAILDSIAKYAATLPQGFDFEADDLGSVLADAEMAQSQSTKHWAQLGDSWQDRT